jgi:ribokinase
MQKSKILVIGSSNTDMVAKTVRLPKPGETIIGGDFFMFAGGKGANQAVAAARLGAQVTFGCNLGNDLFGKKAIEYFQKDAIDISYATLDLDQPTGVAVISVDKNAENTIIVAPGANATLSPKHISNMEKAFQEADIILTQLEIPLETTNAISAMAKKHQKRLIINPAPARTIPSEVLNNLFLITPNETETELLTGVYPDNFEKCETATAKLLSMGVQHVIITLGEKGAFFKSKTESFLVASEKVKAIDTTAAGDVFNGALAVSLANGKNWKESISFANKAAAFSVTKMGAQTSAPNLKELIPILN